jgi:protein-ribulosamine 3-kinase
MNIPEAILAWCQAEGHGNVQRSQAVGGGCINNGARLYTDSGETFFVKLNWSAPTDMFAREAEGLNALAVPDGPRVPAGYLAGEDFLLLEDLKPAPPQPGYWEAFGQRLAALHNHVGARYGFEHDNYCGSTPQPNTWCEDGYHFFSEHRLRFQAQLASQRGLLQRDDLKRVERICERLPELIPAQPASLIHGDLWSGNAIAGPQGEPAIIDPAAHYGWAEAELGMTTLFGGFPHTFYDAYVEARPLAPGWRQRLPLYNLYHLLNHVNLFGGGYLSQTRRVLRSYT